jgi:capsule polysaccharide modification protein KpsS
MAKRPAEKENITFRLGNDVLARISQEAEQKGVSMNSVAQNVFSDYFDWSAYAPRAGMIPLHKTVLGMMVDRLSEKDIIEIADLFAKVKVKNMILVLRNDYNVKAFLDVFEAWLKASSHSFTKHINHETEVYTVTHELGNKWSTYLSHMLKTIFDEVGLKEVVIEKTDDIIMFKIPLLISRNEKSIIIENQ